MIKKFKWQFLMSSVIILLPAAAGLLLWNELPEQIITHWDVNGVANGSSGRWFAVFAMPLLMLAIHWICVIVTALDPKNKNQSHKVFGMILWICPVISLLVCSFTYAAAFGIKVNIGRMTQILLGCFFVMLGNYMPKCRQNQIIGIKVVWALRNEENWNQTHRFTGKLYVFGGILFLFCAAFPLPQFGMLFLLLVVALAALPLLYSYLYYRKQVKVGTASKEDARLTSFEKKSTKISALVGITIFVFAGIFLFTGKFEVKFAEDAFTIEAAYWEDVSISYAQIESLEYRAQDDANASQNRTFGYGSFTVLMGDFKNAEFGAYTRYSYTSCEACIVLTVNGKVLVLNRPDEESTKELYEELWKRMENVR